jgi:hypothetical protein
LIRLNTVIADADASYLNRLSQFLIDRYGNHYQVRSFTDKTLFKEYMEANANRIDVLLVTPEVYFEGLDDLGCKLVCILSDGKSSKSYPHCEILDKFQLAETLSANVLRLYAEKNNVYIAPKGRKATQIIGVYSPLSGSGKTSVALGLAILGSMSGKEIFYLNIEENATTGMFFDTMGDADLSKVLFYLKAKIKNASVKIDHVKKTDAQTGIHYFSPPKSNLELEEVTFLEYLTLLRELKNMAYYDTILVDMGSGFDSKIAGVLNEADDIVLTLVKDVSTNAKMSAMTKDFEILYEREQIHLYSKLHLVQNKCLEGDSMEGQILLRDNPVSVVLPFSKDIYVENDSKYALNMTSEFGRALEKLWQRVG